MIILANKPFHNPRKPMSEQISLTCFVVDSLLSFLFRIDTIVSAGCDTRAQKIPAQQPDKKVTTSQKFLEQFSFPLVKMYLQNALTVFSNAANFTIVYGTYLIQRGERPLQNPFIPSCYIILLNPFIKLGVKVPASAVCYLTFNYYLILI